MFLKKGYFAMINLIHTLAAGGDIWVTLALLAVMLVVMYFVAIRPSKKQEQEVQRMRDSLQIGDEITTIGGIIGRVVSIKDETCVIETSRNSTKIRILKSAVKSIDVPVEATKPAKTVETSEKPADDAATENTAETADNDAKKSKKSKK